MKRISNIAVVFAVVLLPLAGCGSSSALVQQKNPKPRMVLTCDPECDDNNSMIRYLLFSSDFNTEAIVYSSSEFHWTGDGKGTTQFLPDREYNNYGLKIGPQTRWRWAEGERFIEDCLDEYAQSYPNLKIHDPDYPTPESLKSVLRVGNIEFEGEMAKDTPGSNLIKQIFLDNKPGPVFAMSWGGVNTIARALKSIEEQYASSPDWDSIKKKVSEKVVLCMSGNQDTTYPGYIAKNWPDIGVQRVFGGGVPLGYHAQWSCPEEDQKYYSAEWMKKYITGVGPFGHQVRVWGDGKQMVKGDIFDCFGVANIYTQQQLLKMGYVEIHPFHPTGSFLGEGDTGNYLNEIDNGLRAWEDQSWGGWAGRRVAEVRRQGTPAGGARIQSQSPTHPVIMDSTSMRSMFGRRSPQQPSVFPDFIPAAQNGLAGRFAWTVASKYEDANHYPVVNGPLALEAKPGQKIKIKASAADPDGDEMNIIWRQFKVGTYEGDVSVDSPNTAVTTVTIPADAKAGQTIHLVLEVTDKAQIPLTRYLRTVITVK